MEIKLSISNKHYNIKDKESIMIEDEDNKYMLVIPIIENNKTVGHKRLLVGASVLTEHVFNLSKKHNMLELNKDGRYYNNSGREIILQGSKRHKDLLEKL